MELTWARATIQRTVNGEQILHRRVRLNLFDGTARIIERDGTVTAQIEVDTEASSLTGSRRATLVSDEGETWVAEKAGCNCGGG